MQSSHGIFKVNPKHLTEWQYVRLKGIIRIFAVWTSPSKLARTLSETCLYYHKITSEMSPGLVIMMKVSLFSYSSPVKWYIFQRFMLRILSSFFPYSIKLTLPSLSLDLAQLPSALYIKFRTPALKPCSICLWQCIYLLFQTVFSVLLSSPPPQKTCSSFHTALQCWNVHPKSVQSVDSCSLSFAAFLN